MTDPWMLDSETAKKTKAETTLKTKGEVCPRRNHSIGEQCKACEEVSHVYQTTVDGDPKRKIAGRKSAKASYYANIVFPSNPDKSVVVEMGKKIGDKVLDQNLKHEWLDIAHPKKGLGREMKITKSAGDGNFPSYSIDPVLEKADWDIPDNVLENLVNLDQGSVIDILANETEEIFKVSSLKTDESITVRICPPWKEARDRGEKRILTPVFRHWGGVTREQIENGGVDFGEEEEAEATQNDVAPWDAQPSEDVGNPYAIAHTPTITTVGGPALENSPAQPQTVSGGREPCFGKANVYEEDDEECKTCNDYAGCGRAVLKGGA